MGHGDDLLSLPRFLYLTLSPQLPRAACCPTGGVPMRVVLRLWPSPRALVETSCAGTRGHADPGAAPSVKTSAPVRLPHGIRQQEGTDDGSQTPHRDATPFPLSSDETHMAMPPRGLRRTTPLLPGRHTLSDTSATLAGLRGFLEHRIAATYEGRLNPY